MNDLFKELTSIKSDVRRRFPHHIVNQLFERTGTFLASERRALKIRRLTKLKGLRRKFKGQIFANRQSNFSFYRNQLDKFSSSLYPNYSYCDYSGHHNSDPDSNTFMDYSFTDYYHSQHFFNFSDNNVTHLSLDQPSKAFHQQYSRNSKNRHFDKHRRKRSFRGGPRRSDRPHWPHPMHYPSYWFVQ